MKAKLTITGWLLIACFFFAFSQVVDAQDIELLSSYDINGPTAIFIEDNYAFVGNRDYLSGLFIFDISDKFNPILISDNQIYYYPKDISVQGNYLYIAAGSYGFAIFDISDLTSPSFINEYAASGEFMGVSIVGNYAYLALTAGGFKILDISDPLNIIEVGHYLPTHAVMDVAINGNYAYLASSSAGLEIINISNPSNPYVVGDTALFGSAQKICLKGDLAYIAENFSGFTIVDISIPTNPLIVGHTLTLDRARDISVNTNFAFLADDEAGPSVFNIFDPANPIFLDSLFLGGETICVHQDGYYTYIIVDGISTSWGILGICRFTGIGSGALTGIISNGNGDPLEGTIVTAINTPFTDTTDANGEYFMEGFYTDLHDIEFAHPYYVDTLITDLSLVTGDTVILDIVLEYPPGIDVGVSSIISPVDSVEFGEEHDLVVEVTNHGLSAQTFDVYFEIYHADSSEILVADTVTVYNMSEMSMDTIYFFETLTAERFKSYDVISYTALPGDENIENDTSVAICHGYKSYPQIEEISYTWFPYGLDDIYIRGNYAYIATNSSNETIIVDITNRELPVFVGSIYTHSASLCGTGNYLYFQPYFEDLIKVYDISNPINPILVNSCSTSFSGTEYMAISGDYLYACHPGVSIFDISNPVEPVFISNLNTSGWAINITVDSGFAYISNYYNGLIADISNPASPFITGSITNNSEVTDICISGDYAYVSDNPYGFQVYDVSDPYNPTLFDEYTGLEGTWFIEIQNELIYTDNYQEFIIYEIYEPGLLIPAAFLTTSSPSGWYFTVAGDYIYLPCGQNLKILRFPVSGSGACYYTTGDVNNSGIYNGLDVTYAVAFFKGGPPPPYECECTPGNTWYVGGDVNGSCSFNGLDVTYSVAYFKGGPAPFPCADCPPAQ